ncbi:MAG TPA: hypothetical protein VF049_07985, partial [Nocardioidaceae bacterium]
MRISELQGVEAVAQHWVASLCCGVLDRDVRRRCGVQRGESRAGSPAVEVLVADALGYHEHADSGAAGDACRGEGDG